MAQISGRSASRPRRARSHSSVRSRAGSRRSHENGFAGMNFAPPTRVFLSERIIGERLHESVDTRAAPAPWCIVRSDQQKPRCEIRHCLQGGPARRWPGPGVLRRTSRPRAPEIPDRRRAMPFLWVRRRPPPQGPPDNATRNVPFVVVVAAGATASPCGP